MLVWLTAWLPGFEFTADDVLKFSQEAKVTKRPACPVVMPYFISEFFSVKVVDVEDFPQKKQDRLVFT